MDCRIEKDQIVLKKIKEIVDEESVKVALSEQHKPFSLCCFGHFALLHDNVPVVLTGKARELLAFLACENGRPIAKRTVADALWPGREGLQALDSLYKVCHHLEQLAEKKESPRIHSVRGSLWLDMEQVECDLSGFYARTGPSATMDEQRIAVELYRGPVLAEEYYEWTARLEGFYDMRYLDTVEHLRDYYQKLGQKRQEAYYERLLQMCL